MIRHLGEVGIYYDPEALLVVTFSKGDDQATDYFCKWSLNLALFGLFVSISAVEPDPDEAQIPETTWGVSYYKDRHHLARFWGWKDE